MIERQLVTCVISEQDGFGAKSGSRVEVRLMKQHSVTDRW